MSPPRAVGSTLRLRSAGPLSTQRWLSRASAIRRIPSFLLPSLPSYLRPRKTSRRQLIVESRPFGCPMVCSSICRQLGYTIQCQSRREFAMQPLQILLAVDDESAASRIRAELGADSRIDVAVLDMASLRKCPDVDALLMLSAWAHERYGGRVASHESAVLPTGGEPGSPPFVVTTAPQSMPWGNEVASAGSRVPDDYAEEYRRILKAIADHNSASPHQPIRRLGIHPGYLGQTTGFEHEVRGLRAALSSD